MKIGSHVSMSGPDYILGSVKEAISYGATAFMLYTGAPQNTKRKPITDLKVKEALELMEEHGISKDAMIVHAPYIINLANCMKAETFQLGVDFLKQEIERVKGIGASILVLHPGSHVQVGEEEGLKKIVEGLDLAMENIGNVQIAIETMAGKGSEIGYRFEHIRYIIDHVQKPENIKVCLDTCHLHDAGYDLQNFDRILDEFDEIIGLDRLVCMHINDSKNVKGAKKDRHENIGFGEIGFDALCHVIHNPRVKEVVKILETPYVEDKPPYKFEIEMLMQKTFDEHIQEKIKEQ
ncbi:MAG: deoxyribonuclease IV [Erysipelotrichaceae bacterium]|nr:deoxyribonuclease IV [Erysipelotrichaceae bacterium]